MECIRLYFLRKFNYEAENVPSWNEDVRTALSSVGTKERCDDVVLALRSVATT